MPINPNYIFKISSVYNTTDVDEQNEKTTDSTNSVEWDKGYKAFKKNIRNHLKREQRGRCAFCRIRINTGTSWANLEHLISKTDYPTFMLKPENLVYCCTRCNMSKLKQNVISNPVQDKSLQIFPTNSQGFLIINPYHDNYEDHIDFLDEIIIVSKNSLKGTKTIELYKLYRPELAEDRAYELQIENETINERLIQRLTLPNIDEQVKNQINNIIEQLPNWTI